MPSLQSADRDPLDALTSVVQLAEVLEGLFTRAGDLTETGLHEARNLSEGMESMISFREAHPELEGRFIDVKYRGLVSDPLSVVRRIYRQLEMPLTEVAAERMKSLASMRSSPKDMKQAAIAGFLIPICLTTNLGQRL